MCVCVFGVHIIEGDKRRVVVVDRVGETRSVDFRKRPGGKFVASTMLDDARRGSSGSTSRADLMRRVAGGQEAVFGRVALSSQLLPKRLEDGKSRNSANPGRWFRCFVRNFSLTLSAFSRCEKCWNVGHTDVGRNLDVAQYPTIYSSSRRGWAAATTTTNRANGIIGRT